MTSERSERTGAPPRSLRRRTSDRVLGGVAGGLGDYFNIDPLLIRIGFVGLMIFGGAGLVLYVVAWLLIPAEGQEASNIEGFFSRLGLTPRRLAWIGLALLVIVLISNMPVGGPLDGSGSIFIGPLPGMNPGALWALAIIVTGIVLLRRRDAAAAVSAATVSAAPATAIQVPQTRVEVAPVPPRPRSPLALYVCAAVLLSIGLLAVVSQVAELDVRPGQFLGAALTVIGIGLIVGAWWGRARILILLAVLLMPLAVTTSFITAPLEGGIGDHRYVPVTAAEVQDEYRSLAGRAILDLTELQTSPRTIHIAASVAVGQLVVILPEGASIELRSRVGAGDSYVLGSGDNGTSLDNRYIRHHLNRTTYVLDLEVGIGQVFVTNSRVNW
ncbi:MAG: PspC domain-containing protein [Chloroflexi bacterium]|nr:PspC domain-containing protein [Chloroflexota bacterium]